MRNCLFSILALTIFFIFLIGCQTSNKELLQDEDVSKVSISTSNGFGKVNADSPAVYEDQETLDLFKSVVTNAVKQDGIVDVAEPEFELNVIFADGNKENYYLWVGEKGQKSALMHVKNTHTIYALSEEITDQLVELLK